MAICANLPWKRKMRLQYACALPDISASCQSSQTRTIPAHKVQHVAERYSASNSTHSRAATEMGPALQRRADSVNLQTNLLFHFSSSQLVGTGAYMACAEQLYGDVDDPNTKRFSHHRPDEAVQFEQTTAPSGPFRCSPLSKQGSRFGPETQHDPHPSLVRTPCHVAQRQCPNMGVQPPQR